MVKPGWLEEQFKEVENEVKKWPHWMRREAGLEDEKDKKSAPDEGPTKIKVMAKGAGK
jgi:hypothetical protein